MSLLTTAPLPGVSGALTFVTVTSFLGLTVSLPGGHLLAEALRFARFSPFMWIVMRALFGDWLLGAARAHAFPWLFSVPCVDGPHSSIGRLRHTGPI